MARIREDITLRVTNNLNRKISVPLLGGTQDSSNGQFNSNTLYDYDLSTEMFNGVSNLSIEVSTVTNPTAITYSVKNTIITSIGQVVDLLNTLNIGVFSREGNIVWITNSINIYGDLILTQAITNSFSFIVQSNNSGTSANNQFTIPTDGAGYNYEVATDDGYSATGLTGSHTITFPSGAGTHEVYVTGDFPKCYFNSGGDRLKLLEVENWGTYGITQPDQTGAFTGCNNLTQIADNGDWFDVVTDGSLMFRDNGLDLLPSGMDLPLLTNGFSMFMNNSLTSLPSGMILSLLTNGNAMFSVNSLNSLPIGMQLPLLTNGTIMFRLNTINTARYSQLLIDMASGNVNNNVNFDGGNSQYNLSGQVARDILTNPPRNWNILDGGLEI